MNLLLLLPVLLLQLGLPLGVVTDRLLLQKKHTKESRPEPGPDTRNQAGSQGATAEGKHRCHLLAAGDGAAAQVSAGLGVDHGGNVFLRHQVGEELLAALRLLPDRHRERVSHENRHPAVKRTGEGPRHLSAFRAISLATL